MAIVVSDCPHCLATKASMMTVGARVFPEKLPARQTQARVIGQIHQPPTFVWNVSCGLVCPACNKPVAALLEAAPAQNYTIVASLPQVIANTPTAIETIPLTLVELWPKPQESKAPGAVPAAISKAFIQAETNFSIKGNEEASALMYRRCLELAMKDKFASYTGSLASRIKQTVVSHDLPSPMAEWADEIRDLGNDAAHDDTEVDPDQLRLIRGFTDTLLRYLYTLPAEIVARRKTSQN